MRLPLVLLLLSVPMSGLGDDQLDAQLRRFVEVYNLLEHRIAGPFDPEQAIYQGALPAMVRTLDPHSAFLDRDQFESLREMERSTEKGFGSVVSLLPGRVIVLQTLPESPSARAGLSPGDEIIVINRYSLARLSIQQLVSLLAESKQRKAQLMVRRPGVARLIPMELVPAEMADPSVRGAFFLRPGLAYVKLANFEGTTAEDLRQTIEQLGGLALNGLVLDLRHNPGGMVDAALKTAAFFLKPGQRILWVRGREGEPAEVAVPEGYTSYDFPVCVLVDNQTASAAEILAGALQDHDRATILGVASFGKGLVQSVFSLSEGAALALTTARYLTPSGRSLQRPLENCDLYALATCRDSHGPDRIFHTDQGRTVVEGGGIVPDKMVHARPYSRFEAAMEASNSYFEFARQHLQGHGSVGKDFEVSSRLLDEFQLFLSRRRIHPSLAEWSSTVTFIRSRIKQEVFNLALGVEKGDEIEIRRDPVVQAALVVLEQK